MCDCSASSNEPPVLGLTRSHDKNQAQGSDKNNEKKPEEHAFTQESNDIAKIAMDLTRLDDDNYLDIRSKAHSLDNLSKLALAEELLTVYDIDQQSEAVELLMRIEFGEDKLTNTEFLLMSNLEQDAQLLLLDYISNDTELQADPSIASWLESITLNTLSDKIKAAAIGATQPNEYNRNEILQEMTTMLSSNRAEIIENGLLSADRILYSGRDALNPDDLKALKSKILSIANNNTANIDNRIQALTLSKKL